jgi:CheY-like chemotaxis protein
LRSPSRWRSCDASCSNYSHRPGGEPPVGSTAATPRIVIAEDSEALLDLIVKFVASLGYTPVATGEEALTVTLAAPPALVISDAHLPGISGLEVCQRLKEKAATRGIPFLLPTANAQDLGVEEAARRGNAQYDRVGRMPRSERARCGCRPRRRGPVGARPACRIGRALHPAG